MITSDTLDLDSWEHLVVFEDDSLVRLDFFSPHTHLTAALFFFQSRAKDPGAFVLRSRALAVILPPTGAKALLDFTRLFFPRRQAMIHPHHMRGFRAGRQSGDSASPPF